jgi:hypothetical protein
LDKSIGERGLAVVYVRNDRKIADVVNDGNAQALLNQVICEGARV